MPEGHHLHRLAADCQHTFAGQHLAVSSPQGRFAAGAAQVDGLPWAKAVAHGKQLFLGLGDFCDPIWIHIHLGLIGTFQFALLAPVVGQVRLRLATAQVAADLRGPHTCALITGAEMVQIRSRLGPDPLDPHADPEPAWLRIRRSSKPIAALLMDQSVLSGVGNVYRAEVLFRQRINPMREGRLLKPASWEAIWADLVELMPRGVADDRIDTVRHEHLPEVMGRPPRVDDHGGEVYVYRRHDQPCWVCGSRVRKADLAGRNLYWCGRCQRRG